MEILYDQIGTAHSLRNFPLRIVSLVPSQTELLCDLNLEESIIGITKFCVHPHHLKSTKKIAGGTKNINFDKVRLLNPDIIICNKEENTHEMVIELKKICPVWVTNIITIEDNFKMISNFGTLLNRRAESQALNEKLKAALNDFESFIADKPIKKAAYFIWKNPYMVAGSDNFINEMLKLNHFENIYQDSSRYPEVSIDNMIADAKPEIILLSSEPFPFKEKDVAEFAQFAPDSKILIVDGEMFSWYGSRLLKSFEYFKMLHQRF